jgi:hypothetical protein
MRYACVYVVRCSYENGIYITCLLEFHGISLILIKRVNGLNFVKLEPLSPLTHATFTPLELIVLRY